MEFARWLSPAFAVWCNDRIKELIRHGITATPETILKVMQEPDTIIKDLTVLKDEREKRLAAGQETARLKPKAELMDKVLCSDEKIDVGQAAKILGLPYGCNTLFKKLCELSVFFKYRNEPKIILLRLPLAEQVGGGVAHCCEQVRLNAVGHVYGVAFFPQSEKNVVHNILRLFFGSGKAEQEPKQRAVPCVVGLFESDVRIPARPFERMDFGIGFTT